MALFQYKTRGRSEPKGKPNVYFCCDGADYRLYFNSISKEVLDQYDCTIWYRTSPVLEYDDEVYFELSQMQLFIVPITSNFLCSSSSALNKEFSFAVQQHIPVLPLLQEEGLSDLFYQKCGSLQYLSSLGSISSIERYQEKLKMFLDSVLGGDSLIQEIKKAFTARLFLSYRREDRIYAQKLMYLIHNHEEFCDLAIWYDEFLVPGGNFKHAIHDAISTCDAFIMSVTPRLVEEHNYVSRIEYPLAVEMKKPVLPVEVALTDRQRLEEYFPEVPPCINAWDSMYLERRIKEVLAKIHPTGIVFPKRKYLLGLAFLNGIDVEVDRKRAACMIEEAARLGIPDAAKKLSEMYRFGIGVERSTYKAILWHRHLISILEESCSNDPTTEQLDSLFWEYLQCGNYCIECDLLDDARDLIQQGILRVEQSGIWCNNSLLERAIWAGKSTLGRIWFQKKNYSEALKNNNEALEISNVLVMRENGYQELLDLTLTYGQIGNIYLDMGKLEKAKEVFLKAREINITIANEYSTQEAKQYLAASFHDLGDISYAEGDLAEARKCIESQREILIALADESRSIQDRRSLVLSHNEIAAICVELGDVGAAELAAQNGLLLATELAEESGTAYDMTNLSISYDRLGKIYQATGDLEKAKYHYIKSLNASLEMYRTSSSANAKDSLAVCYDNLGDLWLEKGQLKRAYICAQQSLTYRHQLVKEVPSDGAKRDLSVSFDQLGKILVRSGKLEEAVEYYSKSMQIREMLYTKIGTPQAKRDLATAYDNIGLTREASGFLDEAMDNYQKSMKIREELLAAFRTPQTMFSMIASYDRMGKVCYERGEYPSAFHYHHLAVELEEELAMSTMLPEHRQALAASFVKLGDVEQIQGHVKAAMEWYQKGCSICAALVEERCLEEASRDLSVCYERIGDLLCEDNQWRQARVYIEKCLSIRQTLAEEYQTPEAYCDLSVAHTLHGDIDLQENKLVSAQQNYEKSLEIVQELFQYHDPILFMRDLAAAYSKLGDICAKKGDILQARLYYIECHSFCISLHKQFGTPQSLEDLREVEQKLEFVNELM